MCAHLHAQPHAASREWWEEASFCCAWLGAHLLCLVPLYGCLPVLFKALISPLGSTCQAWMSVAYAVVGLPSGCAASDRHKSVTSVFSFTFRGCGSTRVRPAGCSNHLKASHHFARTVCLRKAVGVGFHIQGLFVVNISAKPAAGSEGVGIVPPPQNLGWRGYEVAAWSCTNSGPWQSLPQVSLQPCRLFLQPSWFACSARSAPQPLGNAGQQLQGATGVPSSNTVCQHAGGHCLVINRHALPGCRPPPQLSVSGLKEQATP